MREGSLRFGSAAGVVQEAEVAEAARAAAGQDQAGPAVEARAGTEASETGPVALVAVVQELVLASLVNPVGTCGRNFLTA